MPESSRQPGSLLALLGLYATLLYTKANYETWKQGISSDERLVINVGLGAIVGIVAVMMVIFWKSSASHPWYQAARRQNAQFLYMKKIVNSL